MSGHGKMEVDFQFGRPLWVFHKDALSHPLEDFERPDGYSDFKAGDCYGVKAMDSEGDAMAEDEEILSAQHKGKIRFVFPEGLICETEFLASETVAEIFSFFGRLIISELKDDVQLFTNRPKRVLTDPDQTLAHAKLVPAANLFVESKHPDVIDIPQSALRDCVFKIWKKQEQPTAGNPDLQMDEGRHSGTNDKRDPTEPPPEEDEHKVVKYFREN